MSQNGQKKRKLSSLEQTVLGLVWLRGPVTIYAVMKDLSLSESSYHKSRAGAAYSVAKRLIDFGLICHAEADKGKEEKRVVITDQGSASLKEWLSPPVPMGDVAHSADLLRLRFFFLEALDLEARLEFIDKSILSLEELKGRSEALIAENQKIGEYYGAVATLSFILEADARIRWLRLARYLIEQPLSKDADWTDEIRRLLS